MGPSIYTEDLSDVSHLMKTIYERPVSVLLHLVGLKMVFYPWKICVRSLICRGPLRGSLIFRIPVWDLQEVFYIYETSWLSSIYWRSLGIKFIHGRSVGDLLYKEIPIATLLEKEPRRLVRILLSFSSSEEGLLSIYERLVWGILFEDRQPKEGFLHMKDL